MSAPRRWIRLDIGWENSDWLAPLSDSAKLAWIYLLGHTKAYGVCGAVKAMTPASAARTLRIPEADFAVMLEAGLADGAIISDGETWMICAWDLYQNEGSAERQRRHRADRSRLSPLRDVTASHGMSRPVTESHGFAGETLTLTETEKSTATKKRAVRVVTEYTPEFDILWKIHPRGPKAEAFKHYLEAVPARISHDQIVYAYGRYAKIEISEKFRGFDLFRWIRDGRWEEYENGNGHKPYNPTAHRLLPDPS